MEFAPDRSSGEPWQVPEQTRTCRVSILERPEQAGGCPLLEECVAVASAPTCVQCLEPARPRPSLGRPRASWRPHHCWGGSTAEAGVSTAPRGLSHREECRRPVITPVTRHQAGHEEQKPRKDGDPETRGISGALIPTSLLPHGPALLGTAVAILSSSSSSSFSCLCISFGKM